MMMQSGQLRDLFDIRQRVSTVDAIGQPVETWDVVGTEWCDLRLQTGLQAIRGGGEASVVRASLRTRWRAYIVAGMRAYRGADAYEIEAVLGDGRTYLDLVCKRVS